MESPFEIVDGTYVLPSWFEVPGIGHVAVNAFLIKGKEPILVDTGLTPECGTFIETLETLIDPAELRWIYLTHDDSDHIGALHTLLERAPRAKVVTTFLGAGKMSLFRPLPMARVYFLNCGESLTVSDRRLTVLRPPLFDSPATTAVFEQVSGLLFSSDCFGAALQERTKLTMHIPEQDLQKAQLLWANIDAPWAQNVDRLRFEAELERIVALNAAWVLSSHLPPAKELTERFCRTLAKAPDTEPFVGPNQSAFEAMHARAAVSVQPLLDSMRAPS